MDAELRRIRQVWGERVYARRQQQGMTQQQLADACGVHQTTISRIEYGQDGIADELRIAIAQALKTDPGRLFGWPRAQRSTA